MIKTLNKKRILFWLKLILYSYLRTHWRLSTILKTRNKSVWSNMLWYVKVYIFWKSIQYAIHWDKTQMLKKIPVDKINDTKYVLFFLFGAPTHQNFTFNFRFLYELKQKVHLSKTVCEIFHFWFCLGLLKFIFLLNKIHGLFDLKTS